MQKWKNKRVIKNKNYGRSPKSLGTIKVEREWLKIMGFKKGQRNLISQQVKTKSKVNKKKIKFKQNKIKPQNF